MDNLEEKMNAILNDPAMMQKIMSIAQSMGQSAASAQEKDTPPPQQQEASPFPDIDISMLRKLSGLARQSGSDKNQQSLLRALGPYLSRERISKLERAMRAAKLASLASTALNSGALSFLTGR